MHLNVYVLFYNLIIFPALFLIIHLFALFNRKYRRGVLGRYRIASRVLQFIKDGRPPGGIVLLHCSSMGEFEHIKPFIRKIKERLPNSKTVVMFFSPSGFENVKTASGVDLFIYSPFDWWFSVKKVFKLFQPSCLIIAKYDVWPNQVWVAKSLNIPCFLINATLSSSAGRLKPFSRWFQRGVYHTFTRVLAISNRDKANYRQLIAEDRIAVVGDTKYDQVIFRSEESKRKQSIPGEILSGRQILVAGSTWPEDEAHLIPVLKQLAGRFPELLMIICPHEPTRDHIERLRESLSPLHSCLYSELESYHNEPVIIIDRIGLLANLYSVAHAAYVGGGFKQNVHNVLEPAVYGIPVLFGPVNRKSHEAQLLKERRGGLEVHSAEELESRLQRIFLDQQYRRMLGRAAQSLVEENRGATTRTVETILSHLAHAGISSVMR